MTASTTTAAGAPAARAQAAAAEAAAFVSRYRWIILLGLITAAIMEVLDTTIINVALPQMAGNLGATQQEISWVSTGYIVANVIILPLAEISMSARRNFFMVPSFRRGHIGLPGARRH